jgi:predicted amidophosphoribosyltransferase
MADCKVCGAWFSSTAKTEICPTCERALERLNGYAVPVVHGRWEEWYPHMALILTGQEMLYRCTACDAKYPDIEGYSYCPRCGAKMDGGNEDGK